MLTIKEAVLDGQTLSLLHSLFNFIPNRVRVRYATVKSLHLILSTSNPTFGIGVKWGRRRNISEKAVVAAVIGNVAGGAADAAVVDVPIIDDLVEGRVLGRRHASAVQPKCTFSLFHRYERTHWISLKWFYTILRPITPPSQKWLLLKILYRRAPHEGIHPSIAVFAV